MARISVQLSKGIEIGGVIHREAILREPTALDVIEATAESERVAMVPTGFDNEGVAVMTPQLVASPTMTGINVLRRQIVSIGEINGPIDNLFFAKLSAEDLNILQRKALELEDAAAASTEVAHRGRSDNAGG